MTSPSLNKIDILFNRAMAGQGTPLPVSRILTYFDKVKGADDKSAPLVCSYRPKKSLFIKPIYNQVHYLKNLFGFVFIQFLYDIKKLFMCIAKVV